MSHFKKIDSPNVTNYSYGFGNGKGNIIEHKETAMFEDAPYNLKDFNELYFYENSKWGIINKSAWFKMDCNNDSWDVVYSY